MGEFVRDVPEDEGEEHDPRDPCDSPGPRSAQPTPMRCGHHAEGDAECEPSRADLVQHPQLKQYSEEQPCTRALLIDEVKQNRKASVQRRMSKTFIE